tara:strand:+ start:54 stop:386 length:333 start_codon:yes stop_codon:yes gene_type:complete
MNKPRHGESRKGDIAEHYAITWLWDNGYEVFKNCGCTGAVDLIALNSKGEVKLIDVKTFKEQSKEPKNLTSSSTRTKKQREFGVKLLGFDPKTRKLRFVNHQEEQGDATA